MAAIAIADDGIVFDGRTPETRPLGGAESALVALAEALAARGHAVAVHNRCERAIEHRGVHWTPLDPARPRQGLPERADLYIANRGDKLIRLMPGARRTVFWIHNPARYLLKWRYLWKLMLARPAIVFLGPYHRATYPAWAPGGARVAIPYGVSDVFRGAAPLAAPPPPRAIFASNPLRSLDWLLDRWAIDIRPRVPGAELHVFAGAATYGAVGARHAAAMHAVLARARSLAAAGVVVREPVPKALLAQELRGARAMLYRGDLNETFCSAVAEAQSVGVPCVVQNLGSVAERIVAGETGFVADGDRAFAEAAVDLLTDDALWMRQHRAALAGGRAWSWDDAAAAFEGLIP